MVTPCDFVESATRKDGGDVTWFEALSAKYAPKFSLEHWGHRALVALFLQTPFLCLFYYPDLIDAGHSQRKTIADTRDRYDNSLTALYRDIQFVGMSVYKQEASRGVAIQEIYIPLTIIPAGADSGGPSSPRTDPLLLLEPGHRHVVLGDPGSGKSTLLRFLALAGMSKALQKRYRAKRDKRLPLLVTLRKYADELKTNPDLGLVDYIAQNVQADFSLKGADLPFLEYYLESGQTILLFDGLDELPGPHFKQIVRDRIRTLLLTYPGNTAMVTSRIVGYDEPFSFDRKEFQHFRIAPLRLPEVEQFVRDWYRVRIENKAERDRNIEDLLRILRDDDHVAIRQLAENPLLLTIVSLVHRIDAVLPDERVVLYQKCTETLLNTWHTWKYRESEPKNRGKTERRNRARMEAIAYWMHCRSTDASKTARAVVPYKDLSNFLTDYITNSERTTASEEDPGDAATEFLEFIRKRAGLLIEVGDGQYSFVHLTFEEYLAATRIITANEAEGVQGIWKTIAGHCKDPRWHEVVRLLVGALRSPGSQNALLDNLLAAQGPEAGTAELLGGLLLDGIEAADERAQTICEKILTAAIDSTSQDSCLRLVRLVRSWRGKGSFNQTALQEGAEKAARTRHDGALSIGVLMPALGATLDSTLQWLARSDADAPLQSLAKILFGSAGNGVAGLDRAHLETLLSIAERCAYESPAGNLAASLLQVVFCGVEPETGAEYLFRLQLSSLCRGIEYGPFEHLNRHALELANLPPPREHRRPRAEGWQADSSMDSLFSALREKAPEDKRRKRRAQTMGMHISTQSPKGSALMKRIVQLRVVSTPGTDYTVLSPPPTVAEFVLDAICYSFGLRPETQWKASLGYTIPNVIPGRFRLLDRDAINYLERRLPDGEPTEGDAFLAAWMLIFDSWCHLAGYAAPTLGISLGQIADLTRESQYPSLRIAHAFRDLIYKGGAQDSAFIDLAKDDACASMLYREAWGQMRVNRIHMKAQRERPLTLAIGGKPPSRKTKKTAR